MGERVGRGDCLSGKAGKVAARDVRANVEIPSVVLRRPEKDYWLKR
jgi:hypothetical protein